jgi:arsenical pump membrane protein
VPPWKLGLAAAGAVAAAAAAGLDASAASAAAAQTWPAFLLVAGLLLVGLAAAADGLFEAGGAWLARLARSRTALFAGVGALVAVVTAGLNLDTSVAFMSPVLVHTARKRGDDTARNRDEYMVILLSLCLLMSNAASLLLPGSNLTNLIVLGSRHISGGAFFVRMALPWTAAVIATALVVGWFGRSRLKLRVAAPATTVARPGRPVMGVGLVAVSAVVILVLAVREPAPWVAAVGAAAAGFGVLRGGVERAAPMRTLDLPVLVGLYGLAVGLGTLGRSWTGPAQLLRHLDPWSTAGFAAVASVFVNNLPAAALLSARPPRHPLSLLIGLDLGPNLFVSGSLAWVLWYASARSAGGRPDVRRTVQLGLVAAPLSMALAVGALELAGRFT